MAEYNSFTYDEIKSSDFGVYIGGEKTFDAPSLRGQSIEIPGRNGNVFISSDSYENVELVYPSFNFEPDLETFRSKLAKLRNALSSRASYKRLTDTLHPDEFRMAVFRDGFEVKPIKYNTAAEFDIVFDCKPQRFLKSGEIPVEYTPGQTPSDEQTKTGSIVTFEAEEGTIISDVKADINPVQDLHGYDKPWAGGNGKNLFNPTDTIDGYLDGNTGKILSLFGGKVAFIKCKPNTTYTVSKRAGKRFRIGETSVYPDINVSYTNEVQGNTASHLTLTTSASAQYVVAWVYYASQDTDITAEEMLATVQIEEGSTATAYEPYENICPISGWDEVKVARTGKNLFNKANTTNYYITTSGELVADNNARITDYIPISNGKCVFSAIQTSASSSSIRLALYDENKGFLQRITSRNPGLGLKSTVYVDDASVKYVRANIFILSEDIDTAQLELGSTATEYEPFGNTYTIGLNGTRYGGTLDVTSGVLKLTKAYLSLDKDDFVAFNTTTYTNKAAFTNQDFLGNTVYMCDSYEPTGNVGSNMPLNSIGVRNDGRIAITPAWGQSATSLAEFKTAMGDQVINLVYELATPITVQLTPTEVKALLGVNNVWADSGDITVKYGTSPYIIVNPTDFPSKPLLEVTGVGSFWLGDTQITITGTSGQIIYIDCETGECYKVTGGIISPANGLVTLNRLDFPKLASGINNIQLGAGISKVKITPRWWRL